MQIRVSPTPVQRLLVMHVNLKLEQEDVFHEFIFDVSHGINVTTILIVNIKWLLFKTSKKTALTVDAVYIFPPQLMLCCHRSLFQCLIANGLISEGERCERGKGNVQCCVVFFSCLLCYIDAVWCSLEVSCAPSPSVVLENRISANMCITEYRWWSWSLMVSDYCTFSNSE